VELFPDDGASLEQANPVFKIVFKDDETLVDAESIRLSIDHVDVTQLAKITDTEIIYHPAAGLDAGKHAIAVEMRDINGNRMIPRSWYFTVVRTDRLRNANLGLQLDGELRHMVASHRDNREPKWHIQSSVSLNSRLEAGSWRHFLDANGWYMEEEGVDQEKDKFNLNNYLYQARDEKRFLLLGDVSVEGTELIGQSIARRGGVMGVNLEKTRLQAFALRSNAITGVDHFFGIDERDQRLTGMTVSHDILEHKALTLQGMYLAGRNYHPDNYNSSTLEEGSEGDTYSLGFVSELLAGKIKFKGEFSSSRYDGDINDYFDKKTDQAWLVKLSGRGRSYDWGAGYKYLGANYRTIVNATGARNQGIATADFGLRTVFSSFHLHLLQVRDNVDEDSYMPVVTNDSVSFTWNMTKEGWPSTFLKCSLNYQNSSKEPENFLPIRNRTYTVGGGFSLSGSHWSLVPSYTYTTFRDESSGAHNDSDTHVVGLSGSLRPTDTFWINPSFSYTSLYHEAADVKTETFQGTIGATYTLPDHPLNVNATLSYLDNQLDNGSSHTSTFNGIAQLNWHLDNLLPGKGSYILSLRGQYNQMKDHVSCRTTGDYNFFVIFSFSRPVKIY